MRTLVLSAATALLLGLFAVSPTGAITPATAVRSPLETTANSSFQEIADVFVRGYYRKNGTYVQPHYRSAPDKSYNINWTVAQNVNPHTGKVGTNVPTWNDRPPSQSLYPPTTTLGNGFTPLGR